MGRHKSMDAYRDPCPSRIVTDCGSAFAMGAIGGSLWHGVIMGWPQAPRGMRMSSAITALKTKAPSLGQLCRVGRPVLQLRLHIRLSARKGRLQELHHVGCCHWCSPRCANGMEGISEERCGGRWSAGVDRGYCLRHLATKPSAAAGFRLRAAPPAARGCARRGGEGRFPLQPHQPLLEEGGIETLRDGGGDDDGRFRSGDEGGRFWRSLPATARHLLGRQLEHRREGTLLSPLIFYPSTTTTIP